MPEASEH